MEQISLTDFNQEFNKTVIRTNTFTTATFELTKKCNLNCIHCYQTEKEKRELDFDEICKILKQLKDYNCLYLVFTGGEPFIREDFMSIYLYAKKIGFVVSIMSNGTLITDKILNIFKNYPPYSIEISLYSYKRKVHEKITRKRNSFNKSLNNIIKLSELNIDVMPKAVVMKDNFMDILLLKHYVEKKLKLRFNYDAVIVPKINRDKSPLKVRLSPEEIIKLEKQDIKKMEKINKIRKSLKSNPIDRKKLYNCGAGRLDLYIDAYGILHICNFITDEGFDLRRGSLQMGINDYIMSERMAKRSFNSPCLECDDYAICLNCAARAYLMTGKKDGISEYLCELTKLRGKKLATYEKEGR